MPIGKNAIKRVTGTKAEAPKEEKSIVAEVRAEPKKVEPKKTEPKKAAPKKAETKKAETKKAAPTPKKSMETEPAFAPVNTLEKVVAKKEEKGTRQGEGYVNLGGELPYYLL